MWSLPPLSTATAGFFVASQRPMTSKWGRFDAHQGLKAKNISILLAGRDKWRENVQLQQQYGGAVLPAVPGSSG
ncbi:hypothetical protein [Pantoea eucrina]|uniref:hypothetical protein n=1 Tax=Pantoea eucrina TaxID=472693 RepID=UPI00301D4F37